MRLISWNVNGLRALFKKELDLFLGNSHNGEGKAVVHLIGPLCNSACADDIGHGYFEVVKDTGGLMADICDSDRGKAMDAIFDDLIIDAPPARLERTPISASLALAHRGRRIPRSKTQGFDYHGPSNSLLLINMDDKPGDPAMAAYRRWWRKGDTRVE